MQSLPVIFSRTPTLAAAGIRLAAWWGQWSHCGVVDGDAVIECLALKGGVVRTPMAEFMQRCSAADRVDLLCPSPRRAIEWSRSLLAAPGERPRVRYDWGGVLGIPLRARGLDDPGRLYCSEHLRVAAGIAGLQELVHRSAHGIHPTTLYHLMHASNAGAVAMRHA